MRAIVMLFTKTTRGESEEFVYADIESVKITVKGGSKYSIQPRFDKKRMFDEALQCYFENNLLDPAMSARDFGGGPKNGRV